jgi:hypothetical protein
MSTAAVDLGELSKPQLQELVAAAKRILYPEAKIVGKKIECSACGKRCVPKLIEDGMTVTHNLKKLSVKGIEASGWDGSSSDVSEEGDLLLLECTHYQGHCIPESTELDWV